MKLTVSNKIWKDALLLATRHNEEFTVRISKEEFCMYQATSTGFLTIKLSKEQFVVESLDAPITVSLDISKLYGMLKQLADEELISATVNDEKSQLAVGTEGKDYFYAKLPIYDQPSRRLPPKIESGCKFTLEQKNAAQYISSCKSIGAIVKIECKKRTVTISSDEAQYRIQYESPIQCWDHCQQISCSFNSGLLDHFIAGAGMIGIQELMAYMKKNIFIHFAGQSKNQLMVEFFLSSSTEEQ